MVCFWLVVGVVYLLALRFRWFVAGSVWFGLLLVCVVGYCG